MADFDIFPKSSSALSLTITAGVETYSNSVTLVSSTGGAQMSGLGFLIQVPGGGTGFADFVLQTAVSGASDADDADWKSLALESVILDVPLDTADTHRARAASFLLDKVRMKCTGDANAVSGAATIIFLVDSELP